MAEARTRDRGDGRPEGRGLGGPGRMRKDHIAEQTFYQGPTTNKNKYDFPTLASIDTF